MVAETKEGGDVDEWGPGDTPLSTGHDPSHHFLITNTKNLGSVQELSIDSNLCIFTVSDYLKQTEVPNGGKVLFFSDV